MHLDSKIAEILPADSLIHWIEPNGFPRDQAESMSLEKSKGLSSALRQSFRWGEPYYFLSDEEGMNIVLPLTMNMKLTGGLVVELPEDSEETLHDDLLHIRDIGDELMALLEEFNLLNTPLMRERAREANKERLRAEAIHASKSGTIKELRNIYWQLEPELFLNIKRGEKNEARRLLNQLLINIYHFGKDDFFKIKGYLLDLLTNIRRTMIECGANPDAVIGNNIQLLEELNKLEDEEALSGWVSKALEDLMNILEVSPTNTRNVRIQLILNYIREHCHEKLSREIVAEKVGLSVSHLTRIMKSSTGNDFATQLNKMRTEKATKLLTQTNREIFDIAIECGFEDQSYFTKVFKRFYQITPARYRKMS